MATDTGPERPSAWRLFVALPVPEAARDALHGQLAPYRRAFPDARWLDPASWHVTLVFLGQVPADRVPALTRACATVAADREAFDVEVAGGGGRVRRDDGVAWLRVGRGARGVIGLAEALDDAIGHTDPGGPAPRRAPSAHLTVARRAAGPLLRALQDESLGPLAAGWRADRIHLLRSHLGRGGARYEVLDEAALPAA